MGEETKVEEPKMTMKGLGQLVAMGMGTIAGDIKEVNLGDPERSVVMELEANNFEDAEGNPLWKPDDEGYVEEGSGNDTSGLIKALSVGIPVLLGVGTTCMVVATLLAL